MRQDFNRDVAFGPSLQSPSGLKVSAWGVDLVSQHDIGEDGAGFSRRRLVLVKKTERPMTWKAAGGGEGDALESASRSRCQ